MDFLLIRTPELLPSSEVTKTDMSPSPSSRTGLILLLVGAVAGLVIALHAYFAPLTGVTSSVGALAVIVVCALLAGLALLLGSATSRRSRIGLRVLIAITLLSICFAALLLHQWGICVAMGVGAVGLIVELVRPAAVHHAACS